ncbi:MAG: NAD(P)/FAD-dependent oxidoreductase, partial [Pseudomonadota bacterium]
QVRGGADILSANWDESSKSWRLRVNGPNGPIDHETPFLITATGPLSNPVVPRIPGLDAFSGDIFHSADWPEGYDISNKNVAIVGTGASAMQIAPSIAEHVSSLAIYQRTPQWVRPIARYHEPIDPDVQWLLQSEPLYAAWTRFGMFWRYGDGLLRTLKIDPNWPHPDRAVNRTNDKQRELTENYIREKLQSRPDLIEKCVPDYPIFGKRILLDNGWYDALLRPNVSLITDAIENIDASGIRTLDGEHRTFDTIVMSTGFDVAAGASRLNITGRNGVQLSELWRDDNPSAYLGLMAPNFPNLFIMQGPGTGLGHGGSAIFVSECQAHFISRALNEVASRNARTIEVRQQPF